MIQDIAPQKLDNQYYNKKIESGDSVLCFHGPEVCIQRGEDNHLTFPTKEDFPQAEENAFRYLFRIDDTNYFLYQGDAPQGYPTESARLLRQRESKDKCFAAATGIHLDRWYRDNRFCGRCGSKLKHAENERMLKCPDCGNEVYPKIAPAVIVGVTDGNRLLLTKYAGRVYKLYALIAGFTEIGETVEETVVREVKEEVGLDVDNVRYWGSQPWGTDQNLLMGFFCDLAGDDTISLDDEELAVAEWFEREDIPVGDDYVSLTRAMVEAFKRGEEH